VDDEWPGLADFRARGERILSGLGDVRTVLRTQVVDEVVISVPLASLYAQASSIVAACEEQGVIIRVLANLFNLRVGRVVTDDLAGIPVTTVHTGAMRGWPIAIKRFLDVAIAAILLTLSLPLLLFVAAAIKLSSPGPVLFVQERIGLNKRRFRLYKFRTMVPGAELEQAGLRHLNEATGPVFKMRADPRVTSVGRVLRRTSIDELPQLFNVLTGDMSMVGPRPLPVRDYEGFDEDRHRRRFSVRPGLTCLWQVSGRHLIPFEGWMALDLHYIDHWSLWLDIKTMLRTIPAVIRGVSRFRDPGRGQGLAGVRRYLGRWQGKLSVRSGTARIGIVPDWDDDVPLVEHLAPFAGSQVQVTIPERVAAGATATTASRVAQR